MSLRQTVNGAGQVLADLGPVIVFVATFNLWNRRDPEAALNGATAVFMATTAAVMAFSYARTKSVSPALVVSGVIVAAFGALTLAFRDPTFLKIKPTVVYLFYATAIFGAMAFGKNVWKLLFARAFRLPDRVWKILAVRWGLFFIAMAGVNEAIRLTQPTDVWVNSRLFVGFPLVAAFMALNLPITLKNIGKTEGAQDAKP